MTNEATRTFLFADLRDYTGFVERMGDQAAAALVGAYRRLIRERVKESSGAEIKVEGDAIFVTFPSARQAISCGASILQDAAAHTLKQPELPMRIGIGLHSGEPVAQEDDFIGATVNVAARIGAAAGGGQLLISDVVRGLVRTGAPFPLRDRGPVFLKGLSEPIHLYEVAWSDEVPGDSATLLQGSFLPIPRVPSAPPSSRLVGRKAELDALQARIKALRTGTGGAVLIAGEAGLGKSRLLREALVIPGAEAVILYGACGLSEAPPPYEPFVAMIRAVVREPDGEAGLRRIAPELLAFVPETATARAQVPDRDHLYGAFLRALRQYARVAPVIVVIEDLHWADEATLGMLQFLVAEAGPTPFLVLATYRSDEIHRRHRLRPFLTAIARRDDASVVTLRPLPGEDSLALLRALPAAGGAASSDLAAISQRAEGNPLFLEELIQTQQGAQAPGVPASLAETVLQRVSRAGDAAGRLLNYLAVIGPRANYDLLEHLMPDEAALLQGARAAVEQHLVVEEGDSLAFRHALTREAILGEMMARERRVVHRAVGETIERLHGNREDQAADIAGHLGAAGLRERALPFAMRAGERAIRLHAPDEAARNFESAVEWSAAGSRERMLALEGLGRAYARLLLVRKATTTYGEALELARSIGTPDDVARLSRRLAFAMPYGRDEYRAWQVAWDAAEPLGQPKELARLATGLASRALHYLEDEQAAEWVDRALVEARKAKEPEAEARARRVQAQLLHRPGWQAEEERSIREQVERTVARDEDVLGAMADLLVRSCRESDQAERERILGAGRAYAERLALPSGIVFHFGVAWINWLTGNWAQSTALWEEVRSRWSEDAGDIYPDAGPLATAIEIEISGPDAYHEAMTRAVAPSRRSETWRGLLTAAAHEANLWLAGGRPELVLENLLPILTRRPPQMLDIESFALASRVVLPAVLLTGQRLALDLWLGDPGLATAGAFYQAAVDHARAVAALLDGNSEMADEAFARSSTQFLDRGWLMLAHELAWQWAQTESPGAVAARQAAMNFYDDQGATWRLKWLAGRTSAEEEK